MKTDHLPRHIEEHVKHCHICRKNDSPCPVATKLIAESEIIRERIAKLPLLSSYAKKPK